MSHLPSSSHSSDNRGHHLITYQDYRQHSCKPSLVSVTYPQTCEELYGKKLSRKAGAEQSISPLYAVRLKHGMFQPLSPAVSPEELVTRIEPLIYRSVIMLHLIWGENRRRVSKFMRTFRFGSKPPDFYATYVKNICIYDLQFEGSGELFWPVCRNLVNLTLLSRADPTDWDIIRRHLQPNTFPKLKRLTIRPRAIPDDMLFSHPIFHKLTHLRLHIPWTVTVPWHRLSSLKSLTYLCVEVYREPASQTMIALINLLKTLLPHTPPNLRCIITPLRYLFLYNRARKYGKNALDVEDAAFSQLLDGRLDQRIVLGSVYQPAHILLPRGLTGKRADIFWEVYSQVVPVTGWFWNNFPDSSGDDDWLFAERAERIVQERVRRQKALACKEYKVRGLLVIRPTHITNAAYFLKKTVTA